MSLSRLRGAATLSCLFLILGTASLLRAEAKPAKEEVVRRGPGREPVPYRYDPALVKQVPKAFLEDGPACILYAGTTYVLEADGSLEEVSHELTRLNNRRGVELLGEYGTISYDPSYQTVTLNEARVHKPGGRTVEVPARYVHVRDTNTDYAGYDHYKQLVISFPDLAAGDVIEIKWTVRGKDPEGQGHFFASFPLGNDDYPVYLDELRVQLPRARALRHVTQGGKLDPAVQERGDTRLYHWHVRQKPPLPPDGNVPAREELRLKVHLSTFATWDEVAAWYRQVRSDCWECTPELKQAARDATRGLKTDAEKARALTGWVRRNVRYLSSHERESFAPHKPALVHAHRYGDCKDQSQLLAVLLREAGIKAGVAIISWPDYGDITESFPSPWGNHAIVLATIDGHDKWIDPVMSHAAWDVLPQEDCDRLTFVMDDKGPLRLVRTPPLKPEQNRTEQTTRLVVVPDGSSKGERTCTYHGLAASNERTHLLELSESARRAHVLTDLQELHHNAVVSKVTVDANQLHDLEAPLTVKVDFEAPKHFADGSITCMDMQVWHSLLNFRAAPDRKVPLALGAPCELKHRFVVELSPGYRFSGVVENKTTKTYPWGHFTRASVTSPTQPRKLEITTQLVLTKGRVEPKDVAEFQKFHKEVTDLYAFFVTREEVADLADAPALEEELKKAPQDVETALCLARLYRAHARPADAARVLRTASAYQARDERLPQLLLEVVGEQEAQLKKERGQAHYQMAQVRAEQGKYQQALDELNRATAADPNALLSYDGLELKGRVCEKLGKAAEAAAAYRQVLTTLDASEVRALAGVTRLAIAANNRVEALDSLRHYTAAIGTANAPLLAAAADLHLQLDRHDDALDLATRSQKLSASAAASRVLGLVCLHRGDHAEAAKHLKAALDLAADKSKPDRQVQEALLRAHLGRGDPSAAEAAVKELGGTGELPPSLVQLRTLVSTLTARRAALLKDARVPGEKAAAWCQALDRLVCAEQVHADGRPAKQVEALLAEALAGGVECGPAHGLRGLLALERGRLSQALADAEKAVALSPAEPRGHYVRGRVRLERGDARALADLEKAAELSRRQDGGVLHWLAAALFQAGRGKDAVVTQREALQRRPGDGELAEQLRRFEEAQRAGGGQQ